MDDFPDFVPYRERITRLNIYFGLMWAIAVVLVVGIWARLGGFAGAVAAVVLWLGIRSQARRAYAKARATAPDSDQH